MWEINVTINEYIHFMFTLLYHQIRQLALWMTAGVCFFLPLLFSFLLVLLGFHPQICLFCGSQQSKKEMVVSVNVLDQIRRNTKLCKSSRINLSKSTFASKNVFAPSTPTSSTSISNCLARTPSPESSLSSPGNIFRNR